MILRGQDNKVLRSVSGEVLTKSDAIIDLRSTFGVTKNASNEVSQIKLYNNPSQVFRAPVGNEPIEQDNGLEFDGVDDFMIINKKIDLLGDFEISFRIKFNDVTASHTILGNSPTNSTWRVIYLNGFQLIRPPNTPITTSPLLVDVWYDITISRKDGVMYSYIDGNVDRSSLFAEQMDGGLQLGLAAQPEGTYKGNFNIENLKIISSE